jgi:hypothetical protein
MPVSHAAIDQTRKRSSHSDSYEFVSVALFSGTGFLISLVAIIVGLQVGWY